MNIDTSKYTKLIPRPTIIVSTISDNGVSNAAPFSFNCPISFTPPLYGFSSVPTHHTWKNIEQNQEFVINIIDNKFGKAMQIYEKKFPYEESEIEKAGMAEEKSKMIKPPRIKEAIAWFECKLFDSKQFGDHVWVVGEIVCIDIKDEYWHQEDSVLDVDKANILFHISKNVFGENLKCSKYDRA
jgi:flavin reductase (DIM6/NTAB) family NADH-FMN oxidoreductase RutF